MGKNVYSGPRAALDRLKIENLPVTPLIQVPDFLNPLRKEDVQVYAKIMADMPWGHMKTIMMAHMLRKKEESGLLEGVETFVEATSGNSGSILAVLGPLYGKKVEIIVPRDASGERIARLIVEGAKVSQPDIGQAGVDLAREKGKQKGYLNLGQYDNLDNVEAHKLVTAAQIYSELGDDVTHIAVPIGTAGAAIGCVELFTEELHLPTKVIGVLAAKNQDGIPGMRTRQRLVEIGTPWRKIHYLEEVAPLKAYIASRRFVREAGIEGGPSSGGAFVGGIQRLKRLLAQKKLDQFRNKNGQILLVVICPDSHGPYTGKYSTIDDEQTGF